MEAKERIMKYKLDLNHHEIIPTNTSFCYCNQKFGNICKENTLEFIFNDKLSESMLNYFFESYYEKKNCNLFVIHFNILNFN